MHLPQYAGFNIERTIKIIKIYYDIFPVSADNRNSCQA